MPFDVTAVPPDVSYTASGAQTTFSVPFGFLDDAHLVVTDNGIQQILAAHYTVTGAGVTGGGSITFLTGRTAGHAIRIRRVTPRARTSAYTAGGALQAEALEQDLDRQMLVAQEINASILDLPDPAVRAGKYLFFDADGAIALVTGDPTQPLTHQVYIDTIDAGRNGDTVLTLPASYTPGAEVYNLSVFKRGVGAPGASKLLLGIDYAETSATTITVTTPVATGDVFEYDIGEVYDSTVAVPAGASQTFTGITGSTLNLTSFVYAPGEIDFIIYNESVLHPGSWTEIDQSTIGLPFDLLTSDRVTVVAGKIHDKLVAADDSISTAKLQNGAVTAAKLAGALDLSGKGITLPAAAVTAANLAATLDLSGKAVTLPASSVTDANLSLPANAQQVKNALNAAGSAPIFPIRAWGAFNGLQTGTFAPVAGGNIASITRLGVGYYRATFSVAMLTVNYGLFTAGNAGADGPSVGRQFAMVRARTAGYCEFEFLDDGGGKTGEPSYVSFFVVG